MADDVLLNKIAIIERCLTRVEQEYVGYEAELATNLTRQDAIVLNLQRACEASIDLAMHLVRVRQLGLPQRSRDAFQLLLEAHVLQPDLAHSLQAMVGFRNIAVHNYQELSLDVVRSVIEHRLGDFSAFIQVALRMDSHQP